MLEELEKMLKENGKSLDDVRHIGLNNGGILMTLRSFKKLIKEFECNGINTIKDFTVIGNGFLIETGKFISGNLHTISVRGEDNENN